MNDMMHEAAAEIARFRGDAEVARLRLVAAQVEIERLRNGSVEGRETVCPHVRGTVTQYCSLNFTLADEERDAILTAADLLIGSRPGATLRSLLDRLHK